MYWANDHYIKRGATEAVTPIQVTSQVSNSAREAFGNTLDEARANLAGALRDMAETNLLRGEPLPVPDPARADAQADLEEPIYLVLHTGQQLSRHVAAPAR
jgi:hypothetical protein